MNGGVKFQRIRTRRRSWVVICGLAALLSLFLGNGRSYAADAKPKIALNAKGDSAKTSAVPRSSMHQFKDEDGTPTLTNRPDKYRSRKGFCEVNLRYTPVKVAPRYRKFTSPAQYSSGNIAELVQHYSKLYALDENLVHSVMRAESNYNPYAVSTAGARGLMQLMPGTAADMGVTDIFDPAQNIAGGTQYLAKMLSLFNNNVELALAAYNAGPNTVKECGGIPPIPETQQYVRTVCANLGKVPQCGLKPYYAFSIKTPRPKSDSVPVQKKQRYVLHFRSGYTQPADKVIDEDPYYYIQSGNRTTLVRKEYVSNITES